MATVQAPLTPTTDKAPAVANIPAKELSGSQWVARFPGSSSLDDLVDPFKANLSGFIAAMERAGASVQVNNTFRPKERAYLMHWAWMIWHDDYDPSQVPAIQNVLIEWAHPTIRASKNAAHAMAVEYQIASLGVAPALDTLHSTREAIDMCISWRETLKILNKDGVEIEITSAPRTGMNLDLKAVGATYGVKKFIGGERDKPHWSTTGH